MTADSRQQTTEEPVTYRVLSARLRVQRGPGHEDLVVERPVARTSKGEAKRDGRGNVTYLDGDGAPGNAAPTLVTFDEHCQVRIEQLLRIGAIVPWPAAPAEQTADSRQQRAGAGGGKGARSGSGGAGAAGAPVADAQGGNGAAGRQEAIQDG